MKNNSDSSYTHLLKCCDKLGIKGAEEYLNKLLVFDFIIANEDRHFNNFGFIRNADDLSFVGPSVVFDSGSSFGFDKITADILPFKNIESKPFRSEPLEQLKLVTSFKWLEISALERIKEIVKNEFNKFESKYLDKARIDAIVTSTHKRIDYLIGLIRSK